MGEHLPRLSRGMVERHLRHRVTWPIKLASSLGRVVINKRGKFSDGGRGAVGRKVSYRPITDQGAQLPSPVG